MTAVADRATRSGRAVRSTTVDVAIALSALAAIAHFVEAPRHFEWWPASGVAFVIIGALQGALSLALLRPSLSPRVVKVGLWGTVAVVLLYLLSRTVGLPFSPGVPVHGAKLLPGMPILPDGDKLVGPVDLMTLMAEVALVVVLLGLLPRRARRRASNGLMWCGLSIWALAILGALT
jgi:hypothetical protein